MNLSERLTACKQALRQQEHATAALRKALQDVLAMHCTPDGHYRDNTRAMKRARAALAEAGAE